MRFREWQQYFPLKLFSLLGSNEIVQVQFLRFFLDAARAPINDLQFAIPNSFKVVFMQVKLIRINDIQ